MSGLVERLLKRAQEDQTCADNSAIVADALSEQMRLFEAREGHNVYAVRLAVDHQNSMKRDGQYAADLREAAAELTRLQAENASLRERVKEAKSLLNAAVVTAEYAGKQTSTDHIGDEWLTSQAQRALKWLRVARAWMEKEK